MSHASEPLVPIPNDGLGEGACPQCGRPAAEPQTCEWADVARVSNLAEAGFLSDELVGIGIKSRVHQLDEFSAVSDRWSAQYLIRVPRKSAHEAAKYLEQYLFDEVDGPRPVLDRLRNPLPGSDADSLSWQPVIMVLLAGIASFALGQKFAEQNVPRQKPAASLPSAIAAISKRFSTDSVANQPRHRLSFDERRQQWTLETDRENDGVYDETRHYPAGGVR